MKLTFENMTIDLNIFNLVKQPSDHSDQPSDVNMIQGISSKYFEDEGSDIEYLDQGSEPDEVEQGFDEVIEQANQVSTTHWESLYESLDEDIQAPLWPYVEEQPNLELKPLSETLKYTYLGEDEKLAVVIASNLSKNQEESLLSVLKENKEAIGWTTADIKGISPIIVQHWIHLTENAKPRRDPQHRMNPVIKEVVRKDILKCLDNGIIYPISDSSWVSPVQVVPKKSGITVVKNDDD